MKNYICIDGKKAELTSKQLKALGIEIKEDNIFELRLDDKVQYYIDCFGEVHASPFSDNGNKHLHEVANYCTDKELLQQRALQETLNRLLWRYSMEHDGDKIDWNDYSTSKYYICYNHQLQIYDCYSLGWSSTFGAPYFYSKEVAKNAIKEIVEPFMREHPEFKL